jgi:uncharacterized protein
MNKNYDLIMRMMDYDDKNPHRIQHFLKVYEFATLIGEGEQVSDRLMHILQTAAIMHDIGIKPSMEKYGDDSGKHQEEEGPAPAREILESMDYESAVIDRVCYLIGHHHTYTDVDGVDYQILIEADFLVNMHESFMDAPACKSVYERIFRTTTGKRICRKMYSVRD